LLLAILLDILGSRLVSVKEMGEDVHY
jgi:hypothetical protein